MGNGKFFHPGSLVRYNPEDPCIITCRGFDFIPEGDILVTNSTRPIKNEYTKDSVVGFADIRGIHCASIRPGQFEIIDPVSHDKTE
jgi:hypothetical protein